MRNDEIQTRIRNSLLFITDTFDCISKQSSFYQVTDECDRFISNFALLYQHSSCKLYWGWQPDRGSTNCPILPNYENIEVWKHILFSIKIENVIVLLLFFNGKNALCFTESLSLLVIPLDCKAWVLRSVIVIKSLVYSCSS